MDINLRLFITEMVVRRYKIMKLIEHLNELSINQLDNIAKKLHRVDRGH